MIFEQAMFWTGVVTWVVLTIIGLFWTIDLIAEWFIDSAQFKSYVWSYLKSTQAKRAAGE